IACRTPLPIPPPQGGRERKRRRPSQSTAPAEARCDGWRPVAPVLNAWHRIRFSQRGGPQRPISRRSRTDGRGPLFRFPPPCGGGTREGGKRIAAMISATPLQLCASPAPDGGRDGVEGGRCLGAVGSAGL